MSVEVRTIGEEQSQVVAIDDFMANASQIVDAAATLAPFPSVSGHYYPGCRRIVTAEEPVFEYFDFVCRQIAPVLREVFDVKKFQIKEAGFSLVTQKPEDIQLIQRVPHFDTFDPSDFAILHYLSRPDKGGTGFYRHRRTRYERIDAERYPLFRAGLDEDLEQYGPPAVEYISDSTAAFEQISYFEGHFNRLLIYQGAVLHSGIIPDGFTYSPDPRSGRLTGNLFLKGL